MFVVGVLLFLFLPVGELVNYHVKHNFIAVLIKSYNSLQIQHMLAFHLQSITL